MSEKEEKKVLKVPHNTEQEATDHPIIPLVESMLEEKPGDSIVAQEAAGQKSFVNSDTLPVEIGGNGKEVLEAAGVKFLGAVENDDLFQYVELPADWKKVPTEDDRWSSLVDETGKIRADIFYKAASYDRKARMRVC